MKIEYSNKGKCIPLSDIEDGDCFLYDDDSGQFAIKLHLVEDYDEILLEDDYSLIAWLPNFSIQKMNKNTKVMPVRSKLKIFK